MKTSMRKLLLAAGLLLTSLLAHPAIDLVNDDTDIFMVNPAISAARPNVLLMIDNSANWNQADSPNNKRYTELSAIHTVVDGLTDQFNLGMMLWNEDPGVSPAGSAYLRFGIRQMTGSLADTTSNKGRLGALVARLRDESLTAAKSDEQASSSFVYGYGFYEAYRYFRGQASSPGSAGASVSARDHTGNANTRIAPFISGLTDNPLASSAASAAYRSPISDPCQKNFMILISNGADGSASGLAEAKSLLQGVYSEVGLSGLQESTPTSDITFPTQDGGTLTAVPDSGNWIDEWAGYMASHDCGPGTSSTIRPVYTYVIDVNPATNTTAKKFSALLYNTADAGKGRYIPVSNNAQAVVDALDAIFQEIQAVNSVFASTTLPVSNNVRGTSLNQVYIGVFRPDGNRLPRWYGNLKLYKLGANLDKLVDASTPPIDVFNPVTGFTFNTAKSFWTTDSNFWGFRGPDYEDSDVGEESDAPDGDMVEKGAAAQRLREVYPTAVDIANRKVYTCVGGGCVANAPLSTMPFADGTAAITATALKAYGSIALASVTNSGTLATATTVGAHGLGSVGATVTGVTVEGVSPNNYNGSNLTVTVTGATTFTYVLAAPPSDTSALVSATAHGLNAGDRVTVSGATPAGYNVTNALVTAANFGANQFVYQMSAAESSSASGATIVATREFGSVPGTQISGNAGASLATVSWPNHGLSNGQLITVAGASTAAFNVANVAIFSASAGGFQYATSGAIPSSLSATTLTVTTSAAHNLGANGSSVPGVVITGTSCCDGTYTASIISATAFTISVNAVVASTQLGGAFSLSSTVTGTVALANGSGGTRDDAFGTVAGGHGLGSGSIAVNVSALSNSVGNNAEFAVDSPYNATITSATEFTYPMGCSGGGCPAANTTGLTATYTATRSVSGSITQLQPVTQVVTDTTGTMTLSAPVTASSLTVIQAGNTTGATVSSPAMANASLRTAIIDWVRGQDNKEDEDEDGIYTDIRASIHGDVLHSRPAVVNYGRDGSSNDIYVFYGTNDGMFRATKGGFASGAGNEAWSFVAEESFGKLKRLRDNSPAVSGARPKDYFFDGPVTIYTKDVDGDGKLEADEGDKTYLYMSMRRGGRMVYALDVSDPDVPKFLWKRGCPNPDNNTGCTAGWENIGQTWSELKIGYLRALPDDPVLIFGGGYDPAVEDFQPCTVTTNGDSSVTGYKNGSLTYFVNGACRSAGVSPTTVNRTQGQGVYVVNAVTGALIWRVGPDAGANRQIAEMTYAMPSDISILNRDRDTQTRTGVENVNGGFLDRVYAVDTGANIWRIDIDHANPAFWAVNKVAALGGNTLDQKRKFLYSPRVTNDPKCGNFDAIVLGSGDREHPFSAGYYALPQNSPTGQTFVPFQDRFFMVKDGNQAIINPAGTAAAARVADGSITTITNAALTDLTTDCIGECSSGALAALKLSKGWFFNFSQGEKAVTSATAQGGVIRFSTNQPTGSSGTLTCDSDLGIARSYKVDFCTAVTKYDSTVIDGQTETYSRFDNDTSTGLPPSPTPAIVCEGGTCKEVTCTGADCDPAPIKLDARERTFWYKRGGS